MFDKEEIELILKLVDTVSLKAGQTKEMEILTNIKNKLNKELTKIEPKKEEKNATPEAKK